MAAPLRVSTKQYKGNVKMRQNDFGEHLDNYILADDAQDDFPMLDDMLAGVANLAHGERPYRKGLLFAMLRDVPEITTENVKNYVGCSERHARDLAAAMRVLVTAFEDALTD
jgi:hypothetical protein